MAEPGVIVEQWDGNVRNVPPRELRCAPLPASIPLVAWQSLTGDEGWAGSVAEQLLQNPAPVSIIFKPGTDTLTLVREVLDLIPAPQRWNVTFSTYFTRLLAGAECQLRFVLNDTPEATSLRNDARARVIDLTNPLPAATGGTLVSTARKGQLTSQEPLASPQAPASVRTRTAVEIPTRDTAAEISIPKLKPSPIPLETPDKPQPPRDVPPPVQQRSRKGIWIGIIAAVLLVAVTGILIIQQSGKTHDPFAELVSQTVPKDKLTTDADREAQRKQEQAEQERMEIEDKEKLAADEAAKKKDSDEQLAEEKIAAQKKAEQLRQEAMEAQAKGAREAAMQAEGPFIFIAAHQSMHDNHGQWLFQLPKPGQLYDGEWPQLRANGKQVSLRLCDGAKDLFKGCSFQLQLIQNPERLNEWTVEATQDGTKAQIATYTIAEVAREAAAIEKPDREVRFEWQKSASREKMAAELLRWWPLEIEVDGQKAVVLQRVAEIPETNDGRPTWRSLAASEAIPVINTDAIKAVGFERAANTKFIVEIGKDKEAITTIEIPIRPQVALENENARDEDAVPMDEVPTDPSSTSTTCKFFHINPPFAFIDKEPVITDEVVGFGKLALAASQSATMGLTLHPTVSLFLRLPRKSLLEDLPDISTNAGLKAIEKDPQKLVEWNHTLADGAVTNLQNTRVEIRNEVAKWHVQKLRSIPKKNTFESTTFANLSKKTIEKVSSVIPTSEREALAAEAAYNRLNANRAVLQGVAGGLLQLENTHRQMQQAQSRFQEAKKFKPLVDEFINAMGRMSREMSETNRMLLGDYDKVELQVASCLKEEEIAGVYIRCTLVGKVATEGCKSGPQVVVRFLETTSPNWPTDAAQPEAK
jgi:chemotaxis protein histidine kinase CheA